MHKFDLGETVMKKYFPGLLVLLFLWVNMCVASATANPVPEPRFEARESFHVMGISLRDNFEPTAKMRVWIDLYRVQSAIPNVVPGAEYAVTYYAQDYDPSTQKGIVFLVGNEVSSPDDIPTGVTLRTVPAATYAVFEHHGSMESVQETYNYIFSDWMKKHKVRPLGQDIFERYDSRFSFESEESVLEIWVPVPEAKTP